MTWQLLYRPHPDDTGGTWHKNSAEEAVDELATFEATELDNLVGAGWRTNDAAAANTQALRKNTSSAARNARGAVVDFANAARETVLTCDAGAPAELNVVFLDGSSTDIVSSADLTTSAAFSYLGIFRYRPQIKLSAIPLLAWFGSGATDGFANTTVDWYIGIATATGLVTGNFHRYNGAAATTITGTTRVDHGQIFAVAITCDGSTTGNLYVRVAGGNFASEGSATIPAHVSTSTETITIGNDNATSPTYTALEVGPQFFVTAELTAAELDAIIDDMHDAHPFDGLQMSWQMLAADSGTTTLTDAAGNHAGTAPNAWVERRNPFAPLRWEEPVFGPMARRTALSFGGEGSNADAVTAATADILENCSMVFGGVRFPPTPQSAMLALWGPVFATRDIALTILSTGKLQISTTRGSTQKTANSTSTFADGSWHGPILITIDERNSELKLYSGTTLEATATGLSAFAASAVAKLLLGAQSPNFNEARVDIMGPVVVVGGILTTAEAQTLCSGAPLSNEFDPRIRLAYTLSDATDGVLDHGAEALNLTVTDSTFLTDQEVPNSQTRLEALPELYGQKVVVPYDTAADVNELKIRVWDPATADGFIAVRSARLFEGVSGSRGPMGRDMGHVDVQPGTGRNPRRQLSFTVWLTLQEAARVLALAARRAEVVVVGSKTNDIVGQKLAVIHGRLSPSETGRDMFAKVAGDEYRVAYRIAIDEES